MKLITTLLVLLFVNIGFANELFDPAEFGEELTLISLNPTWECAPCRGNDMALQSVVDVASKESSVEYRSLMLTNDQLSDIFFVVNVPTTLVYRGNKLIDTIEAAKDESFYLNLLRKNKISDLNDSEYYKLKFSFNINSQEESEEVPEIKEEEVDDGLRVVRTCVHYETKLVQVGGLLQWSKARGRCLSYDKRKIQSDEAIHKTCTEYEYKTVQTGGLLQRGKVKAFCKRYDVDTVSIGSI